MDEEKTTLLEEDESKEDMDKDSSSPADADTGETHYLSGAESGDTSEVEIPAAASKKKRPPALYIIIACLAVAMAVMGYFLFIKDKTPSASDAQIRQMQQTAQQIQGLEAGVKEKQDGMINLMEQYKEKTGESIGINTLDMSEEEKKLLQQRIKDEKNNSTQALLKEILDKDSEIREMQEKIEELEKLLPKPHVVQKGENHYQIAMSFLLNEKNIDKKEAMKLIERTAIIEPLLPGFKVWNFYSGETYGTSVTQGSAPISPNAIMRRAKKKLVDARDSAISDRDKLAGEIQTLEEKRNEIISQLDLLNNEKENLISKMSDLSEKNLEMEVTVNSLFYLVDSPGSLKKRGILKGGFLKSTKLRDVSPEHFDRTVDLRGTDQVVLSTNELNLDKIKSVVLYPKFYKKNKDYKIEIAHDKKSAAITLVNKGKFKNERVVFAVK